MTSTVEAEQAVVSAVAKLRSQGVTITHRTLSELAKKNLIRKARREISPQEAAKRIREAIFSLVNRKLIHIHPESNAFSVELAMPSTKAKAPRVFVVHGSNADAKNEVARFLERLGLSVTILHERAGRGRTLITKFEEEAAGVQFVVAIMTHDDKGAKKSILKLNPRARQNVVFELGFFIGRLGSSKVCALVEKGVEKPSDFDGVEYIPYDRSKKWRAELVQELEAAEVKLDHALLISALQL